jgi:hypothetical protein
MSCSFKISGDESFKTLFSRAHTQIGFISGVGKDDGIYGSYRR